MGGRWDGVERGQRCDSATQLWEKLMGTACPVDTFCTTAFDLTHLRTNLCVVFLSTGEHGYWHSGF